MRAASVLLLAVLLGACGGPSPTAPTSPVASGVSPTGPDPSATLPPPTGTTASPSAGTSDSPSASPSGGPVSLIDLLPTSVSGVATRRIGLTPSGRTTPKIFLKVLGQLHKAPPDATIALAYTPESTIYAFTVAGVNGTEISQVFLGEHLGPAAPSETTTVALGGKEARRIGVFPGHFVYATGDRFFYIVCPDEPSAADVLQQLP